MRVRLSQVLLVLAGVAGLALPSAAFADHSQPQPDITKMQYTPIGKYGPAGQNTLDPALPGETPSATIPTTNSPLDPTDGLKYNPSGEYVAYDTNLFETLSLPFRAAGDVDADGNPDADDPYGNGGNQPKYGSCNPFAEPDPDGLAPLTPVAGRCPNHHFEYLDYYEETMKEILGPFGVSLKRYPFESPGSGNTKSGIAHNVAAVVPGADHPDETVLVSGHYDQTTEGPASAWDSAEGHAQVIRMAKIMADYWTATGTRPSATIKFIPWDQEESGLLGSADYVDNNIPPGEEDKVRAYFNVDPCAGAYPAFYHGNPEDRVPMTLQLVDPASHEDDPDFNAEIQAFNARAETIVDDVFNNIDDTLSSPTAAPGGPYPIFVSDQEEEAGEGESQRDEIPTTAGGLLLFTSDYANFEAVGVPFFNLSPAFFGPSANGDPNREDGIAILHTPNDNHNTINAMTSTDQTGMIVSEAWAKGMELCAQLESWYMLQPEMAGGQTSNSKVVAYYEALPNEAVRDQDVSFDASGSHQLTGSAPGSFVDDSQLTYSWDFGDGTTGTGKVVNHAYDATGRYTTTLTVTNAAAGKSDTMTLPVEVIGSNFVGPALNAITADDAEDGSYDLAWEFDGDEEGFDHFSIEESTDVSVLLDDDAGEPSTNFTADEPTNAAIDPWQASDSETQKNRGNLFRTEPRSFYTGVSRTNHQPGVEPNDGDSILTLNDPFAVPTNLDTTLTYFSDFANDANDAGRVEVAIDEGQEHLDWQIVDAVGMNQRDRDVMSVSEEPTESMVPNFELRSVDLSRYAGKTIRMRFVYALGDAQFINVFRQGWYVDDISVTAGTYSEIGQTPLDQRSFPVSGRASGTYGYRVTGVYADEIETAASNVAIATVPGDPSGGGAGGGGDGTGGDGTGGDGTGGDGTGGDGQDGPCSNLIEGTKRSERLAGTDGSDRISGKDGRDRLKGKRGDDCLRGGAGRDRIAGDRGDDEIRGGRGRDKIRGAGGVDVIRARGGGRDRVACGSGRDIVFAGRHDRIGPNCERLR